MGFQFRLERVLAHRMESERRATLEMARVRGRRDQEARELGRLMGMCREAEARWEALILQRVSLDELCWMRRHWAVLREDVAAQQEVVRQWEERLAQARDALVNARRDKKSLEILRDKALQRFLQALGRAETAALDEISLRPFVAPGAAEAAREREA